MLIIIFILGVLALLFILGKLEYQKQLKESKQIVKEAKKIENEALNSSSNIHIHPLKEALRLYEKAYKLVKIPEYNTFIQSCKNEINKREQFQKLFQTGKQLKKSWQFEGALYNFQSAKRFFVTEEIEHLIKDCSEKIELSKEYYLGFENSKKTAQNGNISEAITQFKLVYDMFKHPDGEDYLDNLNRILVGKQYFKQALNYDKNRQIKEAIFNYEKALESLPELTESRQRLAILYFNQDDFNQAIKYLQNINTETAKYYRGLIYAKQGDLQKAQKEWKNITNYTLKKQKETLKIMAERQRLLVKKTIQDFVTQDKLENAEKTSLRFIERFGNDPLVTENLESHIKPRLDNQIWTNKEWEKIVNQTENNWLERLDIVSLHNLVIALYYYAQIDSDQLAKLIVTWSTALANIEINPALKNIRWLGIKIINLVEIASKIKDLIERLIDNYKDINLDKYFELRDIYRQEKFALNLIVDMPNCGIRIKEIFITPGCYETYSHKLPVIIFPTKIWGALYTDWGKAVAACLENDIKRAIQIKPSKNPVSETENFAYDLVCYHEGSYHLQQYNWRKGKTALKQAKRGITNNNEWRENIEKLCQKQRQEIDEFNEHLEFAKFWHELLATQAAKSYFVEYKTREIGSKLADDEISLDTGLNELRKLKEIDYNNPILNELIKKIEEIDLAQKLETIGKVIGIAALLFLGGE